VDDKDKWKWQPEPYPDMSQQQHDDLARHMAEHGWDDALGTIIVDEFGNMIDGYKRSQVAWELGITTAPAYVINGAERFPDVAERAARYERLRDAVNNHTVLTDEIEAWLRAQRDA
jgi:hypothetical protein